MMFRPSWIGAALFALALSVSRQAAAQGTGTADASPPQVKVSVFPPCAQPGGLLHVTVENSSASFRPSFFDVFVETDLASGNPPIPTELVALSLAGGPQMPMMLVQVPAVGVGPGGGCIVVQQQGVIVGRVPIMIARPSSPLQHVLGSGQAVSSFFDVFTELSTDGHGQSPAQRNALRRQGLEMLRQAIDAEMGALMQLYPGDSRLEQGIDVLRCLAHELAHTIQSMIAPGR